LYPKVKQCGSKRAENKKNTEWYEKVNIIKDDSGENSSEKSKRGNRLKILPTLWTDTS